MTRWDNHSHNYHFQSLHSPQNIFYFKISTLMRVLKKSNSALLKAACVFSWLRPNGILPWLSKSGKHSSHWGSGLCGHSCGTDPHSLVWPMSCCGCGPVTVCCGQGLHIRPGQPDSLENLASPLVAGAGKKMPTSTALTEVWTQRQNFSDFSVGIRLSWLFLTI